MLFLNMCFLKQTWFWCQCIVLDMQLFIPLHEIHMCKTAFILHVKWIKNVTVAFMSYAFCNAECHEAKLLKRRTNSLELLL